MSLVFPTAMKSKLNLELEKLRSSEADARNETERLRQTKFAMEKVRFYTRVMDFFSVAIAHVRSHRVSLILFFLGSGEQRAGDEDVSAEVRRGNESTPGDHISISGR